MTTTMRRGRAVVVMAAAALGGCAVEVDTSTGVESLGYGAYEGSFIVL
jgi:hypothetical protein